MERQAWGPALLGFVFLVAFLWVVPTPGDGCAFNCYTTGACTLGPGVYIHWQCVACSNPKSGDWGCCDLPGDYKSCTGWCDFSQKAAFCKCFNILEGKWETRCSGCTTCTPGL